MQGTSDWAFGPDDRAIQAEVLAGWAGAAQEMGDLAPERDRVVAGAPARLLVERALVRHASVTSISSRRRRRRAERTGRNRAALPPRGNAPASVRAAPGRPDRSAEARCPAGPAPMMIGAITTCRRSRQPAATKPGHRVGSALDQDAAKTARRQRRQDRRRRDRAPAAAAAHDFDSVGSFRRRPLAGDDEPADAIFREHPRGAAAAAPLGSMTTRAGLGPVTRRTVSCGSSAMAVPTPTTTASTSARSRCR